MGVLVGGLQFEIKDKARIKLYTPSAYYSSDADRAQDQDKLLKIEDKTNISKKINEVQKDAYYEFLEREGIFTENRQNVLVKLKSDYTLYLVGGDYSKDERKYNLNPFKSMYVLTKKDINDSNLDRDILLNALKNVDFILWDEVSYHIELEEKEENLKIEISGSPKGYITPIISGKPHRRFSTQDLLGYVTIRIKEGTESILDLNCIVLSRKFLAIENNDFKGASDKINKIFTNQQNIINTILENLPTLLFGLKSPAAIFHKRGPEKQTPIQHLLLIDKKWKEVNKAIYMIFREPNKEIIDVREERFIWEVTEFVNDFFVEFAKASTWAKAPETLKEIANGHLPLKVYSTRKEITFDTYPNRFVKYFLNFLLLKLQKIQKLLEHLKNDMGEYVFNIYYTKCLDFQRKCEVLLASEFFRNIKTINSLSHSNNVLLMDPVYSILYKLYIELVSGFNIVWEKLEEAIRDPIQGMNTLYEIWCFFKIKEEIENKGYEFKSIKQEYFVNKYETESYLKPDAELVFTKDNYRVRFFYNPTFTREGKKHDDLVFRSYSLPMRPDFLLILEESEDKQWKIKKTAILDAKYRVDFKDVFTDKSKKEEEIYKELNEQKRKEKLGHFKIADIYKMHTYREALSIKKGGKGSTGQSGDKDGNEKIDFVAILYPGDKAKIFCENEEKKCSELNFSKFIENFLCKLKIKGIGAIPLKPKLKEDTNGKNE